MNNISLDSPLARGRTADVFEWEDGQILKLFHNWFSLENVQYEQRIARAVHASGISAPDVIGDIVQVEGRNGLIYERVDGVSMLDLMPRQMWMVFTFAKRFARLHAEMHEHVFTADIPSQRSKLEHRLQHIKALPESLRVKLLERLASLPDGDRVCHGDFHPANVLVTPTGDSVIDWIDASPGNPLADVARTTIIFTGAVESGKVSNPIFRAFIRGFHSTYLKEYFRLRPGGEQEYRRWLPIVAAARISEGIKELETWLLEEAKKI
ncbi:MAG: aminoglycoside phosphotransferase family protein [Anaerolineales bacterium]